VTTIEERDREQVEEPDRDGQDRGSSSGADGRRTTASRGASSCIRRFNKPVEYWYLPDGTHELFQIPQRQRTNQLIVDWFRYWLQNVEDEDPNKASQYERWRAMHR